MTPTEAAWLAGFFDGEGCFGQYAAGREKRYLAWILKIDNTDLQALKYCQQITGCGTVRPKALKQPHHKQQWVWRVYSQRDIQALTTQMLPYLQVKRGIAEEFLAQWKDITPLS